MAMGTKIMFNFEWMRNTQSLQNWNKINWEMCMPEWHRSSSNKRLFSSISARTDYIIVVIRHWHGRRLFSLYASRGKEKIFFPSLFGIPSAFNHLCIDEICTRQWRQQRQRKKQQHRIVTIASQLQTSTFAKPTCQFITAETAVDEEWFDFNNS